MKIAPPASPAVLPVIELVLIVTLPLLKIAPAVSEALLSFSVLLTIVSVPLLNTPPLKGPGPRRCPR